MLTADKARSLLKGEAKDVLARLCQLARLATRAPIAMVGLVEAEHLVLVGQLGVPEPWSRSRRLPLHSTLCRHVHASGEMLVVEDASRHPAAQGTPSLRNFDVNAYCGAPITIAGETVAVLSASDSSARHWTTDDVAVIRGLAATAVVDLERLAARRESAREEAMLPWEDGPAESYGSEPPVPEQSSSEQPVPEQPVPEQPVPDAPLSAWAAAADAEGVDLRYRNLFVESTTPLLVMAADSTILEVNRACEDLLCHPRSELYRMKLSDLAADPASYDRMQREMKEQGSITDAELVVRCGDETRVCLLNGGMQVLENGVIFHGALRDITAARRTQDELVRTALHDPLTALPNRVVFMDRLERLLQQSKRRGGSRFAVVFLDLDNFKAINDTYGHLAGDRLLTAVAHRLEGCVRQEDTIARLGGDEFGILLATVLDAASVILVADRIRESLAETFEAEGVDIGMSASIGIALSVTGYERAEDLLHDADDAMYRAKASGSEDYVIFDHDMHERALAQRQLEEDLRAAVSGDQLAVHYHPVVELDNGSVAGLEALIRWTHPERGVLLPADFMPLAERSGLIVDIGWWVLREACRQLRAWQLEYPDSACRLTMSVNLSAKQFIHPALVEQIDRILSETGLEARCLRLDLTEAVVMQNAAVAARLLHELRDRGIQICLDDFGTGYSSLRQLREFPISTLKIDSSFVGGLSSESTSGREVVQSIIALGRSMAIDAVAEGVETPEQLEQLRQLGTKFAQGFLFSLPLDRNAATSLLAGWE